MRKWDLPEFCNLRLDLDRMLNEIYTTFTNVELHEKCYIKYNTDILNICKENFVSNKRKNVTQIISNIIRRVLNVQSTYEFSLLYHTVLHIYLKHYRLYL